jgi:hypothetical protein
VSLVDMQRSIKDDASAHDQERGQYVVDEYARE